MEREVVEVDESLAEGAEVHEQALLDFERLVVLLAHEEGVEKEGVVVVSELDDELGLVGWLDAGLVVDGYMNRLESGRF